MMRKQQTGRNPSGLSRRALVQGLSLGAGLLPGFSASRSARAASIPKRLIVIVGDGMVYDDCWPTGTGASFTLGKAHAPLEAWKQHLLYIDGVGMVSEELDKGPQANAHDQGAKHALAAASTTKDNLPGGPSIDQAIASRLNSPNPVTKFKTLDVVVGYWGDNVGARSGIIASAANTPVIGTWDPRAVWDRVFADFVAPGSSTGPSLADVQREQQLAVLGFSQGEFGKMASRLGKDNRQRLEAHTALLSDLQKQMSLLPTVPAGAGCAKPTKPAVQDSANFTSYNDLDRVGSSNHTISMNAHAKLVVSAMACDLTRVASFRTGYGADGLYGYTPGMLGTGDMHDLVHKVCMPLSEPQNLRNNPTARNVMIKQCQLEAELVAAVLKELDAVPTEDGKTMLHHTAVLWGGHIGYGSHDLARLPWLIAGQAGGYFRTGRAVKLPPNPMSTRGRPHNDLLLSLADAMGTPMDTFGNPSLCKGPIAELR